jgi:methenyltetrahydromethanopterin cyclohydrolase
MNWHLNERAAQLVESFLSEAETLRVKVSSVPGGGRVIDMGVEAEGGLSAGLALSQVCTAGLAEVSVVHRQLGDVGWPYVMVATDHPVAACLLSQYAGWQISVQKFFAMGSGPMRAASAREALFTKLDYQERPAQAVGVLEAGKLPTREVFDYLAERTNVPGSTTTLLVAPTASIAGTFQVVARVVETALHKLFELGFDVTRIRAACGAAPMAPVAQNDLAAIGRTNDAILYGGRVTLWVRGPDDDLARVGPQVPANASAAYGKPFLNIFEAAGRDFYKIDPHLFSPAEIVFQNVDTGRVHAFGAVNTEVLRESFGV